MSDDTVFLASMSRFGAAQPRRSALSTTRMQRAYGPLNSRRARKRAASLALLGLVPWLAGCPLPLAHTEAVSAPIVGLFTRSDGTPVEGATVAVSVEWGDTTCARADLRGETDSRGAFRLPTIERQRSVTWVVPNFDRALPVYTLCLGEATRLQSAYRGHGALQKTAPKDSLTCVEWEWEGNTRVTCSGWAQRQLVSGGSWVENGGAGWYRLFLIEEPTQVRGHRRPRPRPHVYVQWVEETGTGPPLRVREMVKLPIDPNVTALWEMELDRRGDRWYVRLGGYRSAFMNDSAPAHLVYELGPPGQVTRAEGR